MKKSEKKDLKFPSELRLDLASKDWVIIATGRAKRPSTFKKEKRKTEEVPMKNCPFCNLGTQEFPTLAFFRGKKINLKGKAPKKWTVVSIPNKYPAFLPSFKIDKKIEGGIYQTLNAVGFQEVIVTKDHKKTMAQLSVSQIKEVIDVYQERCLSLMKEKFVNNVCIFHNNGKEAGASIVHPHSQLVTTSLIDTDLNNAISNSKKHFQKTGKCIYCQMIEWELKVKERIVFENKEFLVLCPFASKSAFQMIISPKKHLPYFEKITQSEKKYLAEAFRAALSKLYKGLGDPAYNFYLHTSPSDGKKYPFYHWHWTIIPKTGTWGGFEMGARMEISTIEPEKAAEYLRKQ